MKSIHTGMSAFSGISLSNFTPLPLHIKFLQVFFPSKSLNKYNHLPIHQVFLTKVDLSSSTAHWKTLATSSLILDACASCLSVHWLFLGFNPPALHTAVVVSINTAGVVWFKETLLWDDCPSLLWFIKAFSSLRLLLSLSFCRRTSFCLSSSLPSVGLAMAVVLLRRRLATRSLIPLIIFLFCLTFDPPTPSPESELSSDSEALELSEAPSSVGRRAPSSCMVTNSPSCTWYSAMNFLSSSELMSKVTSFFSPHGLMVLRRDSRNTSVASSCWYWGNFPSSVPLCPDRFLLLLWAWSRDLPVSIKK